MKAAFFALFALVLIALSGFVRADGDAAIVGSGSSVVQGTNVGEATITQASTNATVVSLDSTTGLTGNGNGLLLFLDNDGSSAASALAPFYFF